MYLKYLLVSCQSTYVTGTTDIDELYNKIMRTQDAMIRSREQQVREEVGH